MLKLKRLLYKANETEQQRANRKKREALQKAGVDDFLWQPNIKPPEEDLDLSQFWDKPIEYPNFDEEVAQTSPPPKNDLNPNEVSGQGQRRDINWQFTPWQKLSQLYSASKMATAKRYMPFRSKFNPSYNEDYLVNPQQAIGDVKAVGNSMTSAALKSLNPILGLAQAQAASGNVMNQVPGIYSQYDNQNAQIKNQGSAMRTQISNNARMTNMQNDQRYYQESVVARQNFDNLRSFTSDQYMNNLDYIFDIIIPERKRSKKYFGEIEYECPDCEENLIIVSNVWGNCPFCGMKFSYSPSRQGHYS